MSLFAASGFFDVVGIPAANNVIRCAPGGSGPAMSIPFTGRSSLICWKPISACPEATASPTGVASTVSTLAFI